MVRIKRLSRIVPEKQVCAAVKSRGVGACGAQCIEFSGGGGGKSAGGDRLEDKRLVWIVTGNIVVL